VLDHHTIDERTLLNDTGVRTVEHHPTVDSTNRLAMHLLDQSPALPMLISADEQTAGRGRGGNTWWSPAGALMFSLAIERPETATELPPYSLAVGLAVRAALQVAMGDVQLKVKWPNDIFLEGRKVCGILVEVPPAHRNMLVIGIGINVNNSMNNAPTSIAQTMLSMRDCNGHTFSRTTVLSAVVNQVIDAVTNIKDATVAHRWSQHCWLTGKQVSIQRGERIDTGDCVGINHAGALLLNTADGELAISSGSVVGVNPPAC
jgi:BirA family biotin operon repressor/biotin-[acetyl-CoA-carboxylase] ligase